jgi:MSHA biogenesis protein MshE
MPLGEVLVQQGLISQLELQQTLKLQKNTNEILGCLLVEVGLITDEVLTSVVGRKLHVPFVNLKTFSFRADLTQLLPEPMARRFHALVLDDKDDILLVALADPLNLIAINEPSAQTPYYPCRSTRKRGNAGDCPGISADQKDQRTCQTC